MNSQYVASVRENNAKNNNVIKMKIFRIYQISFYYNLDPDSNSFSDFTV